MAEVASDGKVRKNLGYRALSLRVGEEEPYEIWHASRGLEEMLGLGAGELLGRDCTALCAAASAQSADAQELHRAVASRTQP